MMLDWLSMVIFWISIAQVPLVALGVISYDTKKPRERFYVTVLCVMFSIVAFDNLNP